METVVLCTYNMLVCTTIVPEVDPGHKFEYDTIWSSVGLKVASEKHVADLANYLNTTEMTALYKMSLHNSEALTKVILETLEPIQRANELKATGKNSTNCLDGARKNVAVIGSAAFDSMAPCVQEFADILDNIKEEVNKLINSLKKLAEDAFIMFVTCYTDPNEKSCLDLELGKLNTTAVELTKAVQDVQTYGNAAVEAASQIDKACLAPHSNTLRQKLKVVKVAAKTCLDAL